MIFSLTQVDISRPGIVFFFRQVIILLNLLNSNKMCFILVYGQIVFQNVDKVYACNLCLVINKDSDKVRFQVETALPAIDVRPPAQRQHVACKLKKLQKEAERCERIHQDNFTLIQHLSGIMKTNRLDNYWVEAPPK